VHALWSTGHRTWAREVVWYVCGPRNLDKAPLPPARLEAGAARVWRKVRSYLERSPLHRERVAQLFERLGVSQRTLEYFVVQYAHQHPVVYWLNRTRYPPQVRLEPPEPPLDDSWECLNLHQAYRDAGQQSYNRNLLSPHGRGPVVEYQGQQLQLCKYNFCRWFDILGGAELFALVKDRVLRHKQQFTLSTARDIQKRKRREALGEGRMRKKPKLSRPPALLPAATATPAAQ